MRRQRIDALPKKFGGKWGWRGWCGSCLRRIMLASAGGDWPICLELEQARWRPPPSRWHPAFAARGFQHTPASSQTPRSQPGSVSGSAAPVLGHPAGSACACPRHRDAAAQPCVLPARRGRLRRAIASGCAKSSAAVALTRFQSRHSRMLMITLCFGGIADRAEGDLARIGHAVSTPARPTKYKKRG